MKRKLIRSEKRSAIVLRGEFELEKPKELGETIKEGTDAFFRDSEGNRHLRNDSLRQELIEKIFGVKRP
jgi:hypothetical protein